MCDWGELGKHPNRWASNNPSAHRIQGPRQHPSNLLVVCDLPPWWPYGRRVSGGGGGGGQGVVVQLLRLFYVLVSVVLSVG